MKYLFILFCTILFVCLSITSNQTGTSNPSTSLPSTSSPTISSPNSPSSTDSSSSVKPSNPSITIQQKILSPNSPKYGSFMKPTHLVIHNTANSASARNEANYLHSSSNTSSTSYHYVVDEQEIIQVLPNNINGWHAGDGSSTNSFNRNSIGIEIAKSMSTDNTIKDAAIYQSALLVVFLLKELNIPFSNIVTHQSITNKNCPHDILQRYQWSNYLQLVKSFLID